MCVDKIVKSKEGKTEKGEQQREFSLTLSSPALRLIVLVGFQDFRACDRPTDRSQIGHHEIVLFKFSTFKVPPVLVSVVVPPSQKKKFNHHCLRSGGGICLDSTLGLRRPESLDDLAAVW